MAQKEIIWSHNAEKELQDVLDFYNERNGNPNYSIKLLDEVKETLELLSHNEHIGRLTVDKTTRVLVKSVYLVFYKIQNDNIEILSFWVNRQNPENRIDN